MSTENCGFFTFPPSAQRYWWRRRRDSRTWIHQSSPQAVGHRISGCLCTGRPRASPLGKVVPVPYRNRSCLLSDDLCDMDDRPSCPPMLWKFSACSWCFLLSSAHSVAHMLPHTSSVPVWPLARLFFILQTSYLSFFRINLSSEFIRFFILYIIMYKTL